MGRLLLEKEEEDIVSSAWKHAAAKAGAVQRTALKINDKTASTNAVTFAAIDPKRADKKMYDVVYEEVVAD